MNNLRAQRLVIVLIVCSIFTLCHFHIHAGESDPIHYESSNDYQFIIDYHRGSSPPEEFLVEVSSEHWSLTVLDHFFERLELSNDDYRLIRNDGLTRNEVGALLQFIIVPGNAQIHYAKYSESESILFNALLCEYRDEIIYSYNSSVGNTVTSGPASLESIMRKWPILYHEDDLDED